MSIVDLHAHYSPKEYYDVLMRIGGKSLPEAARGGWAGQALRTNNPNDLPERFERMKDADVQPAGAVARRQPSVRRKA